MSKKIILASSSKYRKELLARLGVSFSTCSPDIDEDSFEAAASSPYELTETLAFKKTQKVFEQYPDSIVIGSDQLATIDGIILGKPHTKENAVKQLELLAGKEHTLITSVCVMSKDKTIAFTDRTFLRMKKLDVKALERYVEFDNPVDCAGSYKLESQGISLFKQIEGVDHTAIMGLPLMRLSETLAEFQIMIP